MPETEPKQETELKKITFEKGELRAGGDCVAYGLDNDSVERVRKEEWRSSFYNNLETCGLKTAPDTSQIHGIFNGKNALCIVVGNGPSFHSNIGMLKKFYDKKRPFILACDRVFNKLCEHGIRPDLTMTLDGQARVAEFFDEDKICANDYFVAMLMTHPDVIKKLRKGKVFWSGLAVHQQYNIDGPNTLKSPLWDEFYSNVGTRFYNTVGNYVIGDAAMRLAATMGFSGVLSLGNDLCFAETTEDKYEGSYNKFAIVIKKDSGDKRYITTESFLLAAMQMSKMPAVYPEIVFFDCSDAPLHHWDGGEFSDVVYEFLAFKEDAFNSYNYRWELQKKYYHHY